MFTLKFTTGNAAFWYEGYDDEKQFDRTEPARILRDIASKIEDGRTYGKAVDFLGNTVGEWELDY